MKPLFLKLLLILLPFASLQSVENHSSLPDDQLLVIFGAGGYVLFKALDFAHDHGFRYVKILKYEFIGFDHTMHGSSPVKATGGRIFELKDDHSHISILCYTEKPEDPYVIDVQNYQSLLLHADLEDN